MLEIIFSLQNTNAESYLARAEIRYRECLSLCHPTVLLDLLQAGLSELLNGILTWTLACSWAEVLQKGNSVHAASDCPLYPLLSCVLSSIMTAHGKDETYSLGVVDLLLA